MKQPIRIIVYVFIIILLVGGSVYVDTIVRSIWHDIAVRQAFLQDVQAQTSHTAVLKKKLDAATADMSKVNATIPRKDGLVEVVSLISAEAVASGIAAQVPVVEAAQVNPETTPDEGYSDVRIHIVASGQPAALASFLHRVEHLPYVLHVASWKIDTIQTASIAPFTNEAPAGEQAPPATGSSLIADISLIIKL